VADFHGISSFANGYQEELFGYTDFITTFVKHPSAEAEETL